MLILVEMKSRYPFPLSVVLVSNEDIPFICALCFFDAKITCFDRIVSFVAPH